MDENLSRGYIQLGWGSRADRLCRRFRSGHPKPPEDRCHCVYFALVLAGVGFLLPYNSFIIAVDYFQDRYPGTTIVFDMSLVYILVAFVAVVVNNLLVETLSLHVRIVFGYILSFFTLLFVAVFEIWFETFDNAFGYKVNLIAVAVVAFGCTVQQSSFYGYTSMLPSRYTQAVMTGESAAGLLISVNRILTKALLEDERFNTVLFFCLSLAVVSICVVVHFALQRTEFVRFYVSLCSAAANESDEYQRKITLEPTEDVGLVDMLDPADSKSGKYGVLSLRSPPASPQPPDSAFQSCEMLDQEPCMGNPHPETFASSSMALHHRSTENIVSDDDDPWRHSSESVAMPPRPPLGGKTYRVQEVVVRMRGTAYTKHIQWWGGIKRGIIARWQVAKSIWPYMLSIALAYFVTLTLFPGIESEIVSCRLGSWMPVIVMAIFNFFDFLGKILASIPYDWSRPKLVLLTFTRILLVPLMAMCAAPRGQPLIPGEGWAMCFSLLLGISNGIFGSVPMILAPSRVPDEQKELTGNIMTLSYSVGLTTGSGVAYLIDYLIGPTLRHPCEGGVGPIRDMFPIKLASTVATTSVDLTTVVSSTLATLTSSISTIIPSLSNGTTLAATVATTILTTNSLIANVTSNSSLGYNPDFFDNSTVVTITV